MEKHEQWAEQKVDKGAVAGSSSSTTAAAERDHLEKELLQAVQALDASNDAVATSSKRLGNILNDNARDVLEAKEILKSLDAGINAVTVQMLCLQSRIQHCQHQSQRALSMTSDPNGPVAPVDAGRAAAAFANISHNTKLLQSFLDGPGGNVSQWPTEHVDTTLHIMAECFLENVRLGGPKSNTRLILSVCQNFKDVAFHQRYRFLMSTTINDDGTLGSHT